MQSDPSILVHVVFRLPTAALVLAALGACIGSLSGGSDRDAEPSGYDAPAPIDALPGSDGGSGTTDAATNCTGTGPAFIHGDLWAFWHNYRVACDRQHKWLWICEQRLGAGNCPEEAQRFSDCWNATGDFPPSTWDGSTPTPHSPNYGVCQPVHWPEKNDPERRPGNPVPCDTTQNDYDHLRALDPRYGVDWWTGATSMRHLTVKVFDQGQDPYAQDGQSDGLVVLSTHPENQAAFTAGLTNHTYSGATTSGGCLPPLEGDDEDPLPAQNFGSFFWVEAPTDRPVSISATWIGPIGDNIDTSCLNIDRYGFPPSFAYHSVDGKPWFIASPCWDGILDVQLEPGRHYVWDLFGFRMLPDCNGPPESLLASVPEELRDSYRTGACAN